MQTMRISGNENEAWVLVEEVGGEVARSLKESVNFLFRLIGRGGTLQGVYI